MNKFFKKIKEAYPKCVLHDDKNYLNFSIGASIVYQLRIQKDVIRIMAWNYPKKLKFGEAFKVIKAEKIESKKVNGEFKIMFEAGVKNPEIFTLRIEIPYKQSYLTKDEFINEIIKACEQFHLRLMPLINAFQTEPVDKLSKLMSLGNTFLKEKKVNDKKENNFKKSNVDKSELNDDIAKNFRDSYEDEEDLAGAMILLSDDFSENGKIVVLEIKEKDLIKVTNNQDLLSGSLFSVLGVVGIKSWQALSKLIGNEEAEWVKNEFKDENPKSIVLLYCNGKYVYAYSDPNDEEPVNDIDEAPVAETISNISTQQELLFGIKNIYKDAEAKKIDIDNFLDIYIPSINPAKGTHLFFNTSKGVIKIGYYVRDEKFINLILEKTSKLIEVASNGLRIPGNPEFTSVNVALMAAKTFLSAISQITSKTTNSTEEDSKKGSKLTKTANKIKTSSETKKSSTNDIVDDFNNAVKSFKSNNLEAVANYVQAGNPGMQFSNDNGVIDNFLIAMTSGGNLNKDKLDLYLSKGLDINATTSDADAYTACHFAAWDGNDDVLKMLIDAGADPDVKGADTITPLNLSSANGHLECVKLLVSSGANIENRVTIPNNNHSEKGGTALRDAVLNLFWDISDFLIKSGASVDVFNETCSNGEDFFSVVKRIILGQENKENNLIKFGALEKKYNKKSIAIKPSKKTDLAPHVKDEKYASLALSVLLEIALDLAGGSKIVPASLYDAGILSERYNGIIGVPSAVIICSGFLEDDVLTMDDFTKNFPTIVNEVRDWFINKSSIDIDDLIPSIKNCIKTIAKEWDDYMRLHGKLLCDSIKKLANKEGLASEQGMMTIQLVLDGLNISEEDWESNREEEEVDEDEQEVDEEEEIEEGNDENIEDFLKNNFDIYDSNDVKNICNRIINDKVLPHLPYINDALASKDYEGDYNKAHFFAPHVYVSDKEMQGFLFVNMDGFYSNCVDLYSNQIIFSWSGVDDIKFKKTKTGCTIEIISKKGILTIKQEGIASLEILYVIYKNIWKLINDRFANEPIIMWNEVDEMGINRKAYFSHENYINDIEGEIEEEVDEEDKDYKSYDVNSELGLPTLDCSASEEKIVNIFLKESITYNGTDNIEARLPKWMKSVISPAVLTPDQIDILSDQIKNNKAIPVLKYAPKEFFNFVKSVWWFVPVAIWKEDVLSLIVVDKNGLNSIAFSGTTEISLISPFDRLIEYTLSRRETTIERLTLLFDNGAFQTFDFFVDEGESGYLSIIAAILDVRMTTINKSKKSDGWKEGAGGEGFIQFDNVAQLYDLKYWKRTEISRPDPRFFG